MLTPVLAAGWAAAPASAHATVISSTPADGGRLDDSPAVLSFQLSEPVSLVEGSTQLIDADGTRCPLAGQRLEDGRQRIEMEPAEPLPDGAYLATARVVSADTHVVSLSIRFTVGAVAEQGQWSQIGSQSVVSRWIVLPVKIVVYLGTVLSAGLLLATRWAWPDLIGSRRIRIVHRVGSGLLLAGLLGRLAILVVEQAGGSPQAWLPAVRTIVGTPFGLALVAAAALSVAAAIFPPGADRSRPGGDIGHRWSATLGFVQAGAAIVAVTLGGHGGSTELWPLPFLVTAVHVYAVAVWLGGVSVIALVAQDIPALRRWHRVALGHVVLVLLAGAGLAVFQVRPLAAVATTSYGLTLVVKVAVVAAAIVTGYVVYRKSRTAVPSGRRRTVAAEAALALVVIALTSSLSSLTPARDSYTTDVATTVDFGGDVLDVHIDTVRRGSQVVTVDYPKGGSAPSEIGIELSSAQANVARLPVEMSPVRGGAGTQWRSDGLIVPAAGRWKVTVRFDDGSGPKLASFFYTVL